MAWRDEAQSALVLTEQEWEDLGAICGHYLNETWTGLNPPLGVVQRRRRALSERIREASKP